MYLDMIYHRGSGIIENVVFALTHILVFRWLTALGTVWYVDHGSDVIVRPSQDFEILSIHVELWYCYVRRGDSLSWPVGDL